MKKKILSGLICSMLVASVGFAAPVLDLEKGQTAAGYNYSRLDLELEGDDYGKETFDGFYVQHQLSDKLNLGLERASIGNSVAELRLTDLIAQYKLDDNVNLALGIRKYRASAAGYGSDSETKAAFGINGKTQLADNLTGYASYLRTSFEDEWKIGVSYQMSQNTYLDLNYAHHDVDDLDASFKGFGLGIGFTF